MKVKACVAMQPALLPCRAGCLCAKSSLKKSKDGKSFNQTRWLQNIEFEFYSVLHC